MFNDRERLKESTALFGETEGARRATGVSPNRAAPEPNPLKARHERPDPEVLEKPARRKFNAQYKLKILKEADAATEYGQVGALLRREGLYSSHLTAWRKQRDKGSLKGLSPSRRGRKPKQINPLAEEMARLQRENHKLQKRLERAEMIIDVQKKVASLLGITLDQPQSEESD